MQGKNASVTGGCILMGFISLGRESFGVSSHAMGLPRWFWDTFYANCQGRHCHPSGQIFPISLLRFFFQFFLESNYHNLVFKNKIHTSVTEIAYRKISKNLKIKYHSLFYHRIIRLWSNFEFSSICWHDI